jgi:hypothetical protein
VRSYLFQQTNHGFQLDVVQAVLSLISCLLFIFVSYMQEEPTWITDVEGFVTAYFLADYVLRLWLAPDDARLLPEVFAQRFGSVVPGARGGVGAVGAPSQAQ